MTNLDSILKSRGITLPTNVRLVKAMVFPIVTYGCASRTIKKETEVAQLCPTLCDPMDCSLPGFSVHGIFHCLLQGIGLTQGSNPGPLHCTQTLYPLSHQGRLKEAILGALNKYVFNSLEISIELIEVLFILQTFQPSNEFSENILCRSKELDTRGSEASPSHIVDVYISGRQVRKSGPGHVPIREVGQAKDPSIYTLSLKVRPLKEYYE